MRSVWIGIVVVMATGCGDPIVGAWRGESPTSCGAAGEDTTDFVVESDLTGQGEVCGCSFTFQLQAENTGDYEADVNFGDDCVLGDGEYNCVLSLDEDSLDCGLVGDYVRAE